MDVMRFLDNVMTDFIENAPEQFSDATYSALRERSVGLGVMGLHSYYQKKNILKNINGIGGIKEITERILQVIC